MLAQWLCKRPPRPFVARLPEPLGELQFLCNLRNPLQRDVFFAGVYEPQVTALVSQLLQPGMTFVDVGANWGYFTLLAAARVGGGGRVAALEPDPRLFQVLRANLDLNYLTRVDALAIAAADRCGTLVLEGFDEAGGNFGLSRLATTPADGVRAFSVEAKTLDVLLHDLQIQTVHLLKMDIEGGEGAAVAGLRGYLGSGAIERLIIELHPTRLIETGSSAAAVMDAVRHAGYRGWIIDHSLSATRQAYYTRKLEAKRWIRPLDPKAPLDVWPHQLWVREGLEPL